MQGNVFHCPAFRLVHAYLQKTEYVRKCSFFSQDEGIHENKRGNIHCAKRSLCIWGFNLFWILLNITSVLLHSPTKVWHSNVVLKSTHVCSYWWNAESFIQYQYVKPHSPRNNNGVFPESGWIFLKEYHSFQRKII